MNDIGSRIRHYRKGNKLKVKELADIIGISQGTLSNIETGETKPSADTLTSIIRNTNIAAHWLLTGEEKKEAALPDSYTYIPLYDVHASAGHGTFVEGENIVDVLAFRRDWIAKELMVSPKDLALIFVDGESMEPTLRPGDMILIVKQDNGPIKDGVYAVRLEDTVLVKRLQRLPGERIEVSSDNPAYKPFSIELKKSHKDFTIIGRVIWAGRRF